MNLGTLIPRNAQYRPAHLAVIFENTASPAPDSIGISLQATSIIRKVAGKKSN